MDEKEAGAAWASVEAALERQCGDYVYLINTRIVVRKRDI